MKRTFGMTLVGQKKPGWIARALAAAAFLGGAALLGGCPIYPDNGGHRVCDSSGCYYCPDSYYSDSCTSYQCNADSDCASGYVCDSSNTCVPGSITPPDASSGTCTKPGDCPAGQVCGNDDRCHPGTCAENGCPTGYVCKLQGGGTPQCVPNGTSPDGGTTTDGGPKDGGITFNGCHADSECMPGYKCIDGTCTAPADQCYDGTQCPSGDKCVDGVCIPGCDATHPCPTGYSCDTTKGVCTINPTPCGPGNDAGMCPNGTTCVDQHCVPPCGPNNTCPSGEVCVDGGCIPEQKGNFVCNTEGQCGDGKNGDCQGGSVCLHHNCYISCDSQCTGGDGGPATCTADPYLTCTAVTGTNAMQYHVCGTGSDLGNQCDLSRGMACSNPSAVCIDGYCR